jgi:Na+/H+ antiporter NhaD/arsenite permease-like protein
VALGGVPRLGLRLDRTGAAVVGAAFMVAFHVVTPEEAYRFIDLGTLVLLFGMMIVVAQLRLAGFFRWAGAAVARRAGEPAQAALRADRAGGHAVGVVRERHDLPGARALVLEVTAALGVPATPYLIALATASNIGSVATLTGNPQNMLIGVASRVPYGEFFRDLLPVALVGLVIDFAVVALVYRRELQAPFQAVAKPRAKVHAFLMAKGLAASLAMLVFFFAGANLSMVALTAGATLLLTRRVKPEKVFLEINWNLLTLFAGLFVVVGAARQAGLTSALFELLHAREARSVAALSASTALLSNLVSNVPAVMLFLPLAAELPEPQRAFKVLAMSSTLAGNLTLLGSIANLIVAEAARKRSPLGFFEYLKVGVPVTLLSLAAGVLLLSR